MRVQRAGDDDESSKGERARLVVGEALDRNSRVSIARDMSHKSKSRYTVTLWLPNQAAVGNGD